MYCFVCSPKNKNKLHFMNPIFSYVDSYVKIVISVVKINFLLILFLFGFAKV